MSSTDMPDHHVQERILSFEDALHAVLTQAQRMGGRGSEIVALPLALGRVLAAFVYADRDQPPFDRSTRDGFAVRAAEIAARGWLTVVGQVRAGEEWADGLLRPEEAVELMTGAPVPAGADAVVMIEHVSIDSSSNGVRRIRLLEGRSLRAGENIVARGSEARAGDSVLTAGTEMTPSAIALAAACGAASLAVFARPTVSILATGDELVDVDELPRGAQIRNSNSYGLEALTTQAGAAARRLPVARDNRAELEQAIVEARRADLLLLSGGVSMGEYDLVEETLLKMGAEFLFTGVRMQPGKPVVFGWLPERNGRAALPFFGLPGNPVSTQVTFACFVEPLLRAMRGAGASLPRFTQATLVDEIQNRPGLTRVLPAKLSHDLTRPGVELVAWQGSGDMGADARANCYAVLPEGTAPFRKGDIVTVLVK